MTSINVNDGLLQVFDVEHGQCALLTIPSGNGFKRLMIDCGHNAIAQFYPGDHLAKLGATFLDQLVITNYDEDHASGYPNLLSRGISIDWILRNPSVSPQTIRSLKSEDGMGPGIDALIQHLTSSFGPPVAGRSAPLFDGVQIEYFWNQYPYFDDENNLSLVLHLTVHGYSFLFSGDMEKAGFDNILATCERFRTVVSSIDVLIASHHGRKSGICPDMFDEWGCRPKLVVISDDYKQYETQETVNYYASKCSGISNFRNSGNDRKVLTTRNDGEICFNFSNGICWAS